MNQGLPLPSLKEFCLHRFNPEFAPDRWSELNHFEESILTISHPTCQPHYHHPQQKRRILRPTNSKLIETNLFCCIPSIPRASNYLTQASNTCKMCFNFQLELRNENLYDRFSHHTIVSVRRNSFRGKLRNAKKIRRNYMFGMKPLTTIFGLASKFKHVRPFCAMYFHQNCPFLHHIRQQYYELCFLKFFGRLSSCKIKHDLELFADKNNCCSKWLKS